MLRNTGKHLCTCLIRLKNGNPKTAIPEQLENSPKISRKQGQNRGKSGQNERICGKIHLKTISSGGRGWASAGIPQIPQISTFCGASRPTSA